MIDEQRTLEIFGYTSSELTHGSDKKIVAVCEECGKYREQTKLAYRVLCFDCSHQTSKFRDNSRKHAIGNSHASKGGGKIIVCKNCGVEFKLRAYGLEGVFCSNKCRWTYMVGENHSRYGTERSEETLQRMSAGKQGIPYEEWDGFTDKTRPHILPKGACTKLNDRFKGSHAHHIDSETIVYIPAELHRHITHNLKSGENMYAMNTLAMQYVNGCV